MKTLTSSRTVLNLLAALTSASVLSACVTQSPRTVTVAAAPVVPQPLYVYPASGQSPEQTDRDRYECHLWAVQQTGVEPSRLGTPTYESVVVQPTTPPGTGIAVGAIGGALLGGILAGPRNAGAAECLSLCGPGTS